MSFLKKSKDKYVFKYNIVVSGSAENGVCKEGAKEKAIEVGKQIAKNKCALISGATVGIPYLASVGNRDAGGFNVGFSPAASRKSHEKQYKLPIEPYDLIIYTGADYTGRDVTMTKSADAVIIICGRVGTLHEFTTAFEGGKLIGVLEGTGGVSDEIRELVKKLKRKPKQPIIYSNDPKELVDKIIEKLNKRYKR